MNAIRILRLRVLVIVFVTSCLTIGCGKRQPTVQEETDAEKKKAVAESFSGKANFDGGAQAESLKRFFDTCSDKLCSGDPERFGEVFDIRMTVRLLEEQKMLPKEIRDTERLAVALNNTMAAKLAEPAAGIAWERHEIRRVQFIKDDVEAVVYVRHWDADDIAIKMRWWLMRDGDRWRAYDYEVLEVSMRCSVLMGVGMKMQDRGDPSVKRIPALMSAVQMVAAGDVESAREILQDLDGAGFPPVIESVRLLMLSAILADAAEFEQALQAADLALSTNPDLPMIHLTKSMCYNGLSEHEKALESAATYAGLLGKDGDYYVEVGDAYAGLGREQEAMEAYQSGLADDPQTGNNVLGLLKIAPAEQREMLARHYATLNDPDEWFVGFADQLLQEEDAETLRVLIQIHRSIMPDDENLEIYEKELAGLSEAD